MRKTAYQVKRVLIGSLSFWQNSQISLQSKNILSHEQDYLRDDEQHH